MTLYGKSFAHFLILFLTFCSSIQKQISSSSAARKIIALSLIKISLLYMEAKKIYEVRTLNCHKLLALISCKELLQRCYTLFPYSLITRRSRSWSSFLYYLLVASFFAWLSFLFLFFSSIEKGTVLSNNLVKPSFIAYMMKWLWARLIAAFLWPLHNLAKILVYKKIHSAIGISKVY